MPKFRILKNSLLGGQISRDALGRTDLPQYAHSCELLQNMIPILSGGAYRRPGTLFHDFVPADYTHGQSPLPSEGPAMSAPPRAFPFITSQSIAYAVLIGTNRWSAGSGSPSGNAGGSYLRFFRTPGGGPVLSFLTYDGIFPYRCKSVNRAVTTTDQCIYTRQGGPGAAANTGVNASSIAIVDVADSLQSFDDDIWSVQFCQANDVMFLTHPDYPPQTVWLNAPDDIRGQCFDYGLTGTQLAQSRPYLNQNSTAATMAISWTGGLAVGDAGTLTSSVAFFNALHGPRKGCLPESATTPVSGAPNDAAIFGIAVNAGSAMSGDNTDNGIFFVKVLSVVSSTVCNVVFLTAPSNYAKNSTKNQWWESAWSNYRGWPRACSIYQQRLCFSSTIHQPSTMWFTATNAYGAPVSVIASATGCKFSALGDGPIQGFAAGVTGTLANGRAYTTPANWVYYPVDDSQGDGQSTGPLGSQPFRVSLATTALDSIQYLSPDQQLFIGTASQEWVGAPENGSFDVANSTFTVQSHYGSDAVQAVRIGYELMFVHQKKDEIRAYQYNYYDQSFFGEPVQLFFSEYPKDEENRDFRLPNQLYAGRRKYRQIDWDSSRSTLWCIDTAGNLFGLTRDRKLSITTWHTHQFGGFNAAHGVGQNISDGLTLGNSYEDSANFFCDGSVVSVCSTPNPMSGMRDIWVVIKRSMGDSTVYSVERIVGGNTVRQSAYSPIMPGTAQEPIYVDSAYFLTDQGDPDNFDYTVGEQLAGETLVGTYYSATWGLFAIATTGPVASDGTVTLQSNLPPDYGSTLPVIPVHKIVVGLPYSSIVQPVRADPPSPVGTSQGAIKRISKAYLRLFKTLMLKMGAPPVNGMAPVLETIRWQPSLQMAQSPEIYTGDKEVFLPTTFNRDGYVYIVQDQPLPFTMVSVSLEGSEYEQ